MWKEEAVIGLEIHSSSYSTRAENYRNESAKVVPEPIYKTLVFQYNSY